MLKIKAGEICPYKDSCIHAGTCPGTNQESEYECSYDPNKESLTKSEFDYRTGSNKKVLHG